MSPVKKVAKAPAKSARVRAAEDRLRERESANESRGLDTLDGVQLADLGELYGLNRDRSRDSLQRSLVRLGADANDLYDPNIRQRLKEKGIRSRRPSERQQRREALIDRIRGARNRAEAERVLAEDVRGMDEVRALRNSLLRDGGSGRERGFGGSLQDRDVAGWRKEILDALRPSRKRGAKAAAPEAPEAPPAKKAVRVAKKAAPEATLAKKAPAKKATAQPDRPAIEPWQQERVDRLSESAQAEYWRRRAAGMGDSEALAFGQRMDQPKARAARVKEYDGLTRDQFDALPKERQAEILTDLRSIRDSGDTQTIARNRTSMGTTIRGATADHVTKSRSLVDRFTRQRGETRPGNIRDRNRLAGIGDKAAQDRVRARAAELNDGSRTPASAWRQALDEAEAPSAPAKKAAKKVSPPEKKRAPEADRSLGEHGGLESTAKTPVGVDRARRRTRGADPEGDAAGDRGHVEVDRVRTAQERLEARKAAKQIRADVYGRASRANGAVGLAQDLYRMIDARRNNEEGFLDILDERLGGAAIGENPKVQEGFTSLQNSLKSWADRRRAAGDRVSPADLDRKLREELKRRGVTVEGEIGEIRTFDPDQLDMFEGGRIQPGTEVAILTPGLRYTDPKTSESAVWARPRVRATRGRAVAPGTTARRPRKQVAPPLDDAPLEPAPTGERATGRVRMQMPPDMINPDTASRFHHAPRQGTSIRTRLDNDYVIENGTVYNRDGTVYLIEHDRSPGGLRRRDAILQVLEAHKAQLPEPSAQRSYTWIEGRNPDDDGFAERFGMQPGTFLSAASADGVGNTTLWNRSMDDSGSLLEDLNHEYGHNVEWDKQLQASIAQTPEWSQAAQRDDISRRRIREFDQRPGLTRRAILTRPPTEAEARRNGWKVTFPYGVTGYGTAADREDWSDALVLYMAGPIGTGVPQGERERRHIFFRDMFPDRAAIFDRRFPEFAERQQRRMREYLRMSPREQAAVTDQWFGGPAVKEMIRRYRAVRTIPDVTAIMPELQGLGQRLAEQLRSA